MKIKEPSSSFTGKYASLDSGISSINSSTWLSATATPEAINKNDVARFKSVASPDGIYLVRKFTSGNLGGRGEELSQKVSAATINDQMEFALKSQTPLSLKIIFPGVPVKDYKQLPTHNFIAKVANLPFDQWGSFLKKAMTPLPEAVEGSPVVLRVAPDCWVYAEAQVIDGILVGGFAVFKQHKQRYVLVAIIELLWSHRNSSKFLYLKLVLFVKSIS